MIVLPSQITELSVFRAIPKILIGECDNWIDNLPISFTLAHTHFCPYDPLGQGTVCLRKQSYLLKRDGTPSNIMWHELGHAIDIKSWNISCPAKYLNHFATNHGIEIKSKWYYRFKTFKNLDEGHGPSWQEIMRQLGKPELITIYGREP